MSLCKYNDRCCLGTEGFNKCPKETNPDYDCPNIKFLDIITNPAQTNSEPSKEN